VTQRNPAWKDTEAAQAYAAFEAAQMAASADAAAAAAAMAKASAEVAEEPEEEKERANAEAEWVAVEGEVLSPRSTLTGLQGEVASSARRRSVDLDTLDQALYSRMDVAALDVQ
jgi:hypothetical protein